MPGPNEIKPNQLMKLIGTQEAPLIFDLCLKEDYALDPRRVPTARRASHDDLSEIVRLAGEKNVVVYCQKGRKISQGAAALLRTKGLTAEVLEGGQQAWVNSDLPTVSMPDGSNTPSRWVTRHRPKIDRVACPWLIRRFIDPAAEFLFVPPSDVELVAEKFGATPFDIEGVEISHDGEMCSFDAILNSFQLQSGPLSKMAEVIRAADTNNLDGNDQAAGLSAICLGLSRLHKDDIAQMNQAFVVFDALYMWARDATDEIHDWPATTKRGVKA